MRNYKAPKIDVVEFEAVDIIQTSVLDFDNNLDIGGTGGTFVPTTSIDEKY